MTLRLQNRVMVVVATGNGSWTMVAFLDPAADAGLDGMEYRNTAIQNCSIQSAEISQSTSSLGATDVFDLYSKANES